MNNTNLISRNYSSRRNYTRRNRTRTSSTFMPITTTIVTTNTTLLLNSSVVPVNDLLAPISYLIENKYFFLAGLIILMFLCVISILFIVILKCTRGNKWKNRRQKRSDAARIKEITDFLDDRTCKEDENVLLIGRNPTQTNTMNANGMNQPDNISTTLSLDPMIEQKIIQNNPPNSTLLSPTADATSIDTLRGSLVSSPSQPLSTRQSLPTPTHSTVTDSSTNAHDRAVETEKDDYLHDLDLTSMRGQYIKAANNSRTDLGGRRTSSSAVEQSIRRKEKREEEAEREFLHGSSTNIYLKEIQKEDERKASERKTHTNSQVSLVSRTSEDSCY